jgi:hypothetical protein
MQVDTQPPSMEAMGGTRAHHTLAPLTTGGSQDHGLQHLCVKLVVGPGASFITILGAGERVDGEQCFRPAPLMPFPASCQGSQIKRPIPTPHP